MRLAGSGLLARGARTVGLVLRSRLVRPIYYRSEVLIDDRFDRLLGINTCGDAHIDDLTIDSANVDFGRNDTIYVPIPILALRSIRRKLPSRSDDYTLVDYGSGKGRVLAYFAGRGFRQLQGIEYAHELHEQALRNLESLERGGTDTSGIECLLLDAVDHRLPPTNCIVFIFHSFEPAVLSRVLNNIHESYVGKPREVVVAYLNPVHSHIFDEIGGFHKAQSRRCWWRRRVYNYDLYVAGPTAPDVAAT